MADIDFSYSLWGLSLWGLALVNAAVFILFAFSFFKPATTGVVS